MADSFSVLGLNGLPLSDELPNRPGYRDYLPSPRAMKLRANYFEMKSGSGLTLYQYGRKNVGEGPLFTYYCQSQQTSLLSNGTSSKLDRVI